VVTLATPFLRVFSIKASENVKDLQFLITPLIMILLVYFLLPATSAFTQIPWVRTLLSVSPDLDLVIFSLILGDISLRLAAAIVRIAINPAFRLPTELKFASRWRDWPNQIKSACYYGSSSRSWPRLLVIRGVDDEASFALTIGAIGVRLTNFLMGLIARLAFTELSRVVRYRWIVVLLLIIGDLEKSPAAVGCHRVAVE